MFRASSAHLQEDIVVYKQHMVPSLSIRVLVACRYAARVKLCDAKQVYHYKNIRLKLYKIMQLYGLIKHGRSSLSASY